MIKIFLLTIAVAIVVGIACMIRDFIREEKEYDEMFHNYGD